MPIPPAMNRKRWAAIRSLEQPTEGVARAVRDDLRPHGKSVVHLDRSAATIGNPAHGYAVGIARCRVAAK